MACRVAVVWRRQRRTTSPEVLSAPQLAPCTSDLAAWGEMADTSLGFVEASDEEEEVDEEEEEEEDATATPLGACRQAAQSARAVVAGVAASFSRGEFASLCSPLLSSGLDTVVLRLTPTPADDAKRAAARDLLSGVLARRFTGVSVSLFGSVVSRFHSRTSDLDVSLALAPFSKWSSPSLRTADELKARRATPGLERDAECHRRSAGCSARCGESWRRRAASRPCS